MFHGGQDRGYDIRSWSTTLLVRQYCIYVVSIRKCYQQCCGALSATCTRRCPWRSYPVCVCVILRIIVPPPIWTPENPGTPRHNVWTVKGYNFEFFIFVDSATESSKVSKYIIKEENQHCRLIQPNFSLLAFYSWL